MSPHVAIPLLSIEGLLALVLFLALMGGPQEGDLKWRAAHHGYLGILGFLAGAWILTGRQHGPVLIVTALEVALSLWCTADDAWQHAVQRWAGLPDYRSPLHRWFAPAFAPIAAFFDRLLGG